MADNRFEKGRGRPELSRAEVESARQALDAASLTQAYQAAAGHSMAEHTTRKTPGLRLLRGGASVPSGEDRWYTIADVARACGLPQPVIAQFVPRTWTKDGWLYTGEQLQSAIQIAEEIRAQSD